MKKLFLIVVLLFTALGAYAQTSTPTPQNQPSAEDIAKAKEIIKSITAQGNSTPQQEQGKTVADVLDKGLDVFSGYVTTLEGVVSKYAPEVWRIMIKQQYAKAIANPLFWGLMLLIPFCLHRYGRKASGVKDGQTLVEVDDDGALIFMFGVVPAVMGIIFGVLFAYHLTEGIMIALNPEYYALKDIIGFLR